jgi:hypothetical protein
MDNGKLIDVEQEIEEDVLYNFIYILYCIIHKFMVKYSVIIDNK